MARGVVLMAGIFGGIGGKAGFAWGVRGLLECIGEQCIR